ncbi:MULTISPECIES: type III secretion system cytoplasmic ring protein SctQ [Vibrio diabolicus subgroup]|uniref:type III secretion system cytoplasmic ring protein SctQ n=1 Tax=Vibrio diabolicus subgroup TaxID=2315253 RepID=UPI002160142B|nr:MULTISPECIES: type III secretion system cytoplasmic ring protein SctQ [Vibrio diabolicus subgroup]MEA3485058.1 type III secretion system cytoplasmic ring protein SctQ [Pseudomonadota bacterium]MCR9846977.1 type III secretion system cytoplasmic ring protein SctQ [Vibrio antiquarius]MCR9915232.1 type III secretion system cytoplasmic ring protein SctQ [Vibrio antiquarius]MCS0046750.1 type III secretion system cytoplasmic ring protein SctQ [Vibrio antiquarius]MCS0455471.1 type III secretion sys
MTPLTIPKVDSDSIALSNQLCAKQCHFQGADGQSVSITVSQIPSFEGFRLTTLIGGQTIQVDFCRAQLQKWLESTLNATAFESLPNSLQLALLSSQIEPHSEAFKALFGQLPILSQLQPLESSQVQEHTLMLTLNKPNGSLCLWVSEGANVLLDALPNSDSLQARHLALPVWLSLGKTHLMLSEFNSLELGDVIFFDDCYIAQQQAIFQVSNQNLWRCQLDDQILHIIEKETNMNDVNTSEMLTDHQQLPVELTFDIGHQTITLEQLNQLQPGYVFELNQPVSKPVTLRANGKIVGECELVNVNEHLGVRVLELFGGTQEPA